MPKPRGRPSKKAKTDSDAADDSACMVDESQTIPVTQVGRLVRFQVADMAQAVKAQEVLKKIHAAMREAKVKGFKGSIRFVCLKHFDFNYWLRF